MMNFFRWLFGYKQTPVFHDSDDDAVMQMVLSECYRTGKTVIASVNDDGTLTMETCEPDESEKQ